MRELKNRHGIPPKPIKSRPVTVKEDPMPKRHHYLKKGPRPGEYTVYFHDAPIGSVRKFEKPNAPTRRHRVRWLIHIFDHEANWKWTRDSREGAICGLIGEYLLRTGSSSARFNGWVSKVKEMLAAASEEA
jgi:hypothetical protein